MVRAALVTSVACSRPPGAGADQLFSSAAAVGAQLEPLVRQYQALIAEEVKADTRKLYSYERFQSGVAEGPESLKGFDPGSRSRVTIAGWL